MVIVFFYTLEKSLVFDTLLLFLFLVPVLPDIKIIRLTDTSVKVEWSFRDYYGSVDFQITYYKKGDPSSARVKNVTATKKDDFVIIYKLEPDAEYSFQVICYTR